MKSQGQGNPRRDFQSSESSYNGDSGILLLLFFFFKGRHPLTPLFLASCYLAANISNNHTQGLNAMSKHQPCPTFSAL